MKVLIAEDSSVSRSVLSLILEQHDFKVITAVDGSDAVEKYLEFNPDIILMDLMMPVMNGYDATQKIKQLAGEKFIPIIILTAMSESEALAKSIEYGADDYLGKPYNADAIHAKIIALLRIKKLHDTLVKNKTELEKLNTQVAAELLVAEHIYDSVLAQGTRALLQVKQYMRPVTNFNGDILMAAHTPSGGFNVMLGDFTGHGLSAAIGAIPVSEIFYGMTKKGFSIGDIVVELNTKLKVILPVNMFCAACLIEIDQERTTVSIWNGSNPDVVIADNSGSVIYTVASSHTALGVTSADKFDRQVEVVSLKGDEYIYMCSDGFLDVRNADGIKFGMRNYLEMFSSEGKIVGVNNIIDCLFSFADINNIKDDISFIEVSVDKSIDSWRADHVNKSNTSRLETEWELSLSFGVGALQEVNPVPLLLNFVNGINVVHGHKERIYTVVSELFNNALDHGLLKLDSAVKLDAEGFQKYFSQKESRLAELKNGNINIRLFQQKVNNNWQIIIEVNDSGDGFIIPEITRPLSNNSGYAGRGIRLVEKICDSVEYNDIGNSVKATYVLNKQG